MALSLIDKIENAVCSFQTPEKRLLERFCRIKGYKLKLRREHIWRIFYGREQEYHLEMMDRRNYIIECARSASVRKTWLDMYMLVSRKLRAESIDEFRLKLDFIHP